MRPRLLALPAGVLALVVLLLLAPSPSPAASPSPDTGGSAAAGRELFVAACASCHGAQGGGSELAPSVIGVGAANLDYQLRTGRMPMAEVGRQPLRKPPAFDEGEIRDLIAYVTSLGGEQGPSIPAWEIDDALLPAGRSSSPRTARRATGRPHPAGPSAAGRWRRPCSRSSPGSSPTRSWPVPARCRSSPSTSATATR